MTKLEQLINELCPDGVEYKTVGEVCTIKKGAQLNKDKLKDNGLYPVVNGGVNPSGYWDEYNFNANLITISQGGASAGYVNFMTTPFWAGAHCYVVEKCEECLNYTYLYHFIKKHQKTFMQCQYGAGIPSLSLKSINAIGIPLPPLSIQSEIVHILDSFTLLTAELTARQKQYAFYRDYLLDFSNEDVTKKIPDIDCSNIKYVKLGDISKIVRGASPRPIKNFITTSSTGINWIKIGDVNINSKYITETKEKITQEGATKSRYVRKGDFILSNSMSFGRPYILEIDGCIHDGWLSISEFEKYVTADYLYYYLISNKLQKEMKQRASFGGAVQNLNADIVRDLEIAVPPLSVQENIVKILDRFDKLNNDMSEGLPAEIEARKKQYEYYRDTLLSFDDKACSHIVKVERERELTRIKAIKWLKLKEIAHYSTDRIDSSKLDENTYVGVDNLLQNRAGKKLAEHIPTSGRYTKYMCNDILIGNIRPYLKKIWFANNDGGTNGDVLDIRVNDYSVLYPRYLYYVLSSDKFFNYDMQNAKGAKMPRGSKDAVMNYPIPVPPLEEQERIVSILDRFDKLCNDISEGLPAEIKARQKQYEYYRDKLLTFKITN